MSSMPDELSVPLDDDEQVSMVFRRIPRGGFLMGARVNKEPRHWEEISDDFYLGQYPVTQQQFAVWTALNGERHMNEFPGNNQRPAESMNWHQATAFCHWLNRRLPLTLNKYPVARQHPLQLVARLPTEAQWEYACSAWWVLNGETENLERRLYTEYHTGDGREALTEAGWFGSNSGQTTHAVGQKVANRHGLHDMHGNVWEWCHDVFYVDAYCKQEQRVPNPMFARGDSTYRVSRGGSYNFMAQHCIASTRNSFYADDRVRNHGFRIALFPERGRGVIR